MHIDNSRYTAFLANPERYRLVYEQNIVPKERPFALARGGHFHKLNEARNKGLSPDATKELILKNEVPSPKARQSAEALFAAFKRKYDGNPDFKLAYQDGKPLAEMEFDIQIPGSPHFIIGAIDEVLEYQGALWLGDTKTANAKSSELKKRVEFNMSSQPLFYLNAARLLGLEVEGMLFRVVTEHIPPRNWIIPVRKTDRQLQIGLLNIHQVAEMITTMRRTFGIDEVWPHITQTYPCNYETNGKSACEYADICQRRRVELSDADLEPFTERVDHLDVMKGRETSNN